MSIFRELKRRNVFKVAIAYVIVGWLLLQVSDTLVPALRLPEWFHSGVAFVVILGFPVALVFAWAFELTPEGIKREQDVDRSQSITHFTGRKLDFAIIALMAVAILYLVLDNYVLEQAPWRYETIKIAVVPFANISQPDDAALAIGISQATSVYLSNVGWDVIPTNADSDTGSADYILTGNTQQSGTAVLTTVRLSDSQDNTVWTQSYHHIEYADIFRLQDQVSRDIFYATDWEITKVEAASALQKPLVARGAQDYFFLGMVTAGRDFWSPSALSEAAEFLDLAIELDGSYVPALTLRTTVLLSEAIVGSATSIDDNIRRANELSARAVRLDDKNEFANMAHARALWFAGNHEQAVLHLQRVAVSVDTTLVRYFLALIQVSKHDLDAASTNIRRAIDLGLDPDASRYLSGLVALSEQNYEKASGFLSFGQKWPTSDGYVHTIAALVMADREQDAVETYRRLRAQFPDESLKAKMDIYRVIFPVDIDIIMRSLRTVGWDGVS